MKVSWHGVEVGVGCQTTQPRVVVILLGFPSGSSVAVAVDDLFARDPPVGEACRGSPVPCKCVCVRGVRNEAEETGDGVRVHQHKLARKEGHKSAQQYVYKDVRRQQAQPHLARTGRTACQGVSCCPAHVGSGPVGINRHRHCNRHELSMATWVYPAVATSTRPVVTNAATTTTTSIGWPSQARSSRRGCRQYRDIAGHAKSPSFRFEASAHSLHARMQREAGRGGVSAPMHGVRAKMLHHISACMTSDVKVL